MGEIIMGCKRKSRIIRIGTYVKIKGAPIEGKVTYIRHSTSKDEPTKYKVAGRYWNKSSVVRKRKR